MLITGKSEALGVLGLMWKRQAGRETEYSVISDVREVWTGYYQSRGCEGTECGSRVDRCYRLQMVDVILCRLH